MKEREVLHTYHPHIKVLHNASVPMLLWRHYKLTAEQARAWAAELAWAADEAEKSFGLAEAARDSKESK